MIGLAGPKLEREERAFLKQVRPSGVIFFKRNVESPSQLRALSASLREILGPSALIGIDQEGGRVARLGPPFTVFPGNDFLGRILERTGRMDLASAQAAAMAEELGSIGVNLNLVPVADVDSNPKNPVIGPRSFGKSPGRVARLVAETVRAYRKAGLLSCAKHFPGHGDTGSDSHKVLPVVQASRPTLFKRELVPFQAAIRAGAPAVMTAHVVYPALDRKNSATLSPVVLKKLLRKALRFRGVTISDDLEMSAIALHESVPDAAVQALAAGCDLLLVCKSLDLAKDVAGRIQKALDRGELDGRAVRESLQRIECLKRLGRRNSKQPFSAAPRSSGWPEHVKLAKEIEKLGGENFLGDCG